MEPNKPNDPMGSAAPQASVNPEMPQPLNTSSPQVPTEMPMGEPTPPITPPEGGLPPQLPNGPQVSKPAGKSNMLMVIVIIVVVLILGAGGYYFYPTLIGQKPAEETTENTDDSQSVQQLNGLQTELDSVEISDPEEDLVDVDQEITLLEATPSAR